jgi:predicted RND superfamily exporter protein
MEQSGKVVIGAFAFAGMGALAAIALLLGLMLRRVLDSVLVVAPLLVGAMATVVAAKLFGIALNFANVIALPLLLGIGVAFNIYFVVNWRNGVTDHLQSPTTRAVLFSAMTTGSAFGSLAVSPHLGTASMGLLLFLSLGLSVAATFVVLPAIFHLIGKPKS